MWLAGDQEATMCVATRLRDAANAHDLEALLECFHEEYRSEQPAHPGRGFSGREQVRVNWSSIFAGVPDFSVELRGHAHDEGQEWAEWRWTGTRQDGSDLHMTGVTVTGVVDGRISWARLYMEPVEVVAHSIDTAVREMTGGSSERS